MTTYTINGDRIHSISDFYAEINRLFMQDEDWKLGESLDAFNDLLYGGFGALKSGTKVKIVWKNAKTSREILGKEATLNWYSEKLNNPAYNQEFITTSIEDLQNGSGKTYFEILLEIINEHPNIVLKLEE